MFVSLVLIIAAATAGAPDRVAMSAAMAAHIAKSHDDLLHEGGAEIGVAVIDGGWAIADFRSGNRREHGWLLFKNVANCWAVRVQLEGMFFETDDLESSGVPKDVAAKLIADYNAVKTQPVAFLPPQKPAPGCKQ